MVMVPMISPASTTAERIHNTCALAGSALLTVTNENPTATTVHHFLHDGSFVIAVTANQTRPRDAISKSKALLKLTDYAPLPVREPV